MNTPVVDPQIKRRRINFESDGDGDDDYGNYFDGKKSDINHKDNDNNNNDEKYNNNINIRRRRKFFIADFFVIFCCCCIFWYWLCYSHTANRLMISHIQVFSCC